MRSVREWGRRQFANRHAYKLVTQESIMVTYAPVEVRYMSDDKGSIIYWYG